MKVFHTFTPEDYLPTLKLDEIMIHLPSQDSVEDGPAYAIDTHEHVLIVENAANKEGRFSYQQNTLLGTFDGKSSEQVKSEYNANFYNRMFDVENLLTTFQEQAYDHQSSKDLMNYVNKLPPNNKGSNVEKIYNKVQETLLQNNKSANCLSPESSMSCGVGVCRNGATYLSEALKANGVDASFVFSDNHAWVRVNDDGSGGVPYDLDTNAYESYIKLPVRTVINDQIVPINNIPTKK